MPKPGNTVVIVFNLSCAAEHKFEGWFASSEDFDTQRERGLLSCPLCGSATVSKELSAPRLNLIPADHAKRRRSTQPQPVALLGSPEQRALAELMRRVIANTEDVGPKFAEEARRIHYNETEVRSIRGVATQEEAQSLAEEGIEVARLPLSLPDKTRLN
jgi:hypothetical protein